MITSRSQLELSIIDEWVDRQAPPFQHQPWILGNKSSWHRSRRRQTRIVRTGTGTPLAYASVHAIIHVFNRRAFHRVNISCCERMPKRQKASQPESLCPFNMKTVYWASSQSHAQEEQHSGHKKKHWNTFWEKEEFLFPLERTNARMHRAKGMRTLLQKRMPFMFHSFPFFSALAYLCGIACLAALFVRVQKSEIVASACRTDFDESCQRYQPSYEVSATICALASFLFIPTASFPAYASGEAPALVWFILFGAACAGLAHKYTHQDVYSSYMLFATPFILGAVYVVCARYAFLRGFPGNLWSLESMVTVSLYSGAEPVQRAGLFCLAAATILHCATLAPVRGNASFLRACVQIGVTQFLFCLFLPVSASPTVMLSPAAGLLVDYVLHWCFTAMMILIVYPFIVRLCRSHWATATLLGLGIALLHWYG